MLAGGGSGHYPAFAGLIGTGLADGAVVGNIFTSPSAQQAVLRGRAAATATRGALHLRQLRRRRHELRPGQRTARSEGIDARVRRWSPTTSPAPRRRSRQNAAASPVTSRSSNHGARPPKRARPRRRRAGGRGRPTTAPARSASRSTAAPCPAPTAAVHRAEGQHGLGLGIHGEPGLVRDGLPTADELAGRWSSACWPRRRRRCPGARRDPQRARLHQVRGAVRGLAHASPRCCATPATPWSTPRSASWSPASTWPAAR